MSAAAAVERLGADPERGLASAEAAGRLLREGPNRLPVPRPRSWVTRLWDEVREFFVLLLVAAAAVSALLGNRIDAGAILVIVILNILLGVVQEVRAERALAAIGKLAAPHAEVVRDGVPVMIPAERLVRGDIVLLTPGDRVPADLRILAAHALADDESLLTGESLPVYKDAKAVLPEDAPVADRRNEAFLGTTVAAGRGSGVVVETGVRTELGGLASTLEAAPPKGTPLAARLAALGRSLSVFAAGICAVVFLLGVIRGRSAVEMFFVAISLAVAAVPEGLPAAVAVALALGVQRMARAQAIVRHLDAIEALGTVTVVCTDKTGTLTLNEMAVTQIETAGVTIDVTGAGYDPVGEFRVRGAPVDPSTMPALQALLDALILSSDGGIVLDGGRWRAFGDPLDAALVAAAMKAGLQPESVADRAPRIGEVPFSPERKRTVTIHRTASGVVAYVKGAVEVIVPLCTAQEGPAGRHPLDDRVRAAVIGRAGAMAEDGMRVVAVARAVASAIPRGMDTRPDEAAAAVERDLVLLGLVGLADPVRPEARGAIAEVRRAGVRPVMISGDHLRTAVAVGREVGLDGEGALTGQDLDRVGDDALPRVAARCGIFARTTPQHKVRILRALQRVGQVVAMTGDGANDAAALVHADVGIAMGRGGTDVAREAADLVLTDDNFATIVAAIREGRTIFENIRKFVLFVLASNVGEVVVVLVGTLAALPAVLTPIQILWINLVTDGLPSAALGVDPPEPDVMARPPRTAGTTPFADGGLAFLVTYGLLIAAVCFGAYLWGALHAEGVAERRTLVFLTLSLSQLVFAFTFRSSARPVLGREMLENPWLLGAVGLSVVLQILVVTVPGVRDMFAATPPRGGDWIAVAGLSCVPLLVSEGAKVIRRARQAAC